MYRNEQISTSKFGENFLGQRPQGIWATYHLPESNPTTLPHSDTAGLASESSGCIFCDILELDLEPISGYRNFTCLLTYLLIFRAFTRIAGLKLYTVLLIDRTL